MIEVLVSLVIIALGLLGLIGLQAYAHQAELESYQRAQALILLNDMVDRINLNRAGARCYAITDATTGAPYVGTNGAGHFGFTPCAVPSVLSLDARDKADSDLSLLDSQLQGAAEQLSGTSVGAMNGARGCISYDSASDQYTVEVAWQGMGSTLAPSRNCGRNLYGNETLRRVVWTTVKIAKLN